MPALVLGDTAGLDEDLTRDFQATGLTHLTAVSGANLTLLLAFLLTVARWVGVRGWWLRGVGLAGVLVFVALCRTEPSVLRAAAMGLVALAALGSGCRSAGLRNFAVAIMILLLVDPFLGRSIGFTLSVLACAGIVWWARSWTVIMNRWLPLIIAESIAVPLAAQLATIPVVAAISERVSVAGLAANALAGPFVGPSTVLGFAAAGSSLMSGTVAAAFGCGAAWSAQVIIWIATIGSQLPGLGVAAADDTGDSHLAGRQFSSGRTVDGTGTGTTVALAAARWRHDHLPRHSTSAAGLAPTRLGSGCLRCRSRRRTSGTNRPRQRDRGGQRPRSSRNAGLPGPSWDQEGTAADHYPFHADHVDGVAGVLQRRRIGQLWLSPPAPPGPSTAMITSQAGQQRIPLNRAAAGNSGERWRGGTAGAWTGGACGSRSG